MSTEVHCFRMPERGCFIQVRYCPRRGGFHDRTFRSNTAPPAQPGIDYKITDKKTSKGYQNRGRSKLGEFESESHVFFRLRSESKKQSGTNTTAVLSTFSTKSSTKVTLQGRLRDTFLVDFGRKRREGRVGYLCCICGIFLRDVRWTTGFS